MGFKEDIEKFKSGIKKDLIQQKRTAARIALKKLIYRSPARSGNYIRSHNVGISKSGKGRGIGKRHAPVVEAWLEPMDPGEKLSFMAEQYAKKIAYISTAQLLDSITIYNVIPYAKNVEYTGWSGDYSFYDPSRGTSINRSWYHPPYHVYGLTVEEMAVIMPLIPKMVSGNINTGII
jgi:hypothetical protein